MKSEMARRRINLIASHFPPNDDSLPTHLLPMNCSSSLHSVIGRRDNRMQFACQGSSSQACFMRPGSGAKGTAPQFGSPLKYSDSASDSSCNAPEAPAFSRPRKEEPYLSNAGLVQPYEYSMPDHHRPPKFSRQNRRINEQNQFHPKNKLPSSDVREKWSPRMNIAEDGYKYIMTVEIPGVRSSDIRVEVNGRNLIVMGTRSPQTCAIACSTDSVSKYHKKEISKGPYQVVWPLPSDVNKDRLSAEFMDGFLEIIIPKL